VTDWERIRYFERIWKAVHAFVTVVHAAGAEVFFRRANFP
jgi:hypothetical protein